MEKDVTFKNLTELYKRVLPALRSKRKTLMMDKIDCISENMIWNCLRETKWSKSNVINLTLCDIVDDILMITEQELINYFAGLEKRKEK